MKNRVICTLLCFALAVASIICVIPAYNVAAEDIAPIEEDNFTVLWTSDPQWYSFKYQNILIDQNDWVVENYDRMNIEYIIHTGDFVDLPHERSQWDFITEQYKKWDDAGLAYVVLAGNHDVDGTDYTEFKEYFGTHRFDDNPWYGKDYDGNRGHYDLMTMGGVDFIFVYLGYGTHTAKDYEWMNSVLSEHSDRIAFLMFHEYLNAEGTRTAIGDEIFNRVVLKNPNVRMVLCGHNYNATRLVEYIDDDGDGKEDRTVYQLMANYQNLTNGGNGYMRFLEFDIEDGTISQRTYSPYLNDFNAYDNRGDEMDEYGYRDEFTIPFDFNTPAQKNDGAPETGKVIINAAFTVNGISVPINYINAVESGNVYNNAGVYDRMFSLDARDAVASPEGLNYIVAEYKDKEGYSVSEIVKGADRIVSVPQNGRVIILSADAKDKDGNAFDIDSVTLGQAVTFSQVYGIASPTAATHIKLTFKGLNGTFGVNGVNRDADGDEWIIFDRLWGEKTNVNGVDNKWNAIFAFTPVEGKENRYVITEVSTESGAEKDLSIPEKGFVLAVNSASSMSSFRNSMKNIFVDGMQVILSGYEPEAGIVYAGESIISKNADDWSYDKSVMVGSNGEDGSVVFYNTNGQWPDAKYNLEEKLTFDPEKTSLFYDITVEDGSKTSIILFFKDSSPGNPISGQYITVNSYLAGVTISAGSGDIVGNNTPATGTLAFSEIDIPAACYNDDGTLTLNSIKVFASGNAEKTVVIREMRLVDESENMVTDGFEDDEESESVSAESTESNGVTVSEEENSGSQDTGNGVLVTVIIAVSVIAVAAIVVLIKKKK